jgi:hypothetical protein
MSRNASEGSMDLMRREWIEAAANALDGATGIGANLDVSEIDAAAEAAVQAYLEASGLRRVVEALTELWGAAAEVGSPNAPTPASAERLDRALAEAQDICMSAI